MVELAGVLDAAIALSGRLEAERRLAGRLEATVNLVGGGVGISEWWELAGDAVAAYQPKGASSLADSYIDLTGNGNDAAPGVAPTWDAVNGWTFNGSTQYLDTGLNPSTDWTVLMQYELLSVKSFGNLAGARDGFGANGVFELSQRGGGFQRMEASVAACWILRPPILSSGNYGMAGGQVYRNGSPDGAASSCGTYAASYPLFIGNSNLTGSPSGFPANVRIKAFVLYDTTLTDAQAAAVATAMAAL